MSLLLLFLLLRTYIRQLIGLMGVLMICLYSNRYPAGWFGMYMIQLASARVCVCVCT
jgi:hypothetical protein